jgi:hypothetical protein
MLVIVLPTYIAPVFANVPPLNIVVALFINDALSKTGASVVVDVVVLVDVLVDVLVLVLVLVDVLVLVVVGPV